MRSLSDFSWKNSTLYSGASLEKCWASLYKHCAFVPAIAPPKMLAFKYLKCIYFLGPPLTPAAPALLLWRVKLPLNVMGTDEYYDVHTHQAKLSKCFEKMDYLRPGQTCDIYIIPILKWRGDHCPRSVRKAGAELVGGHPGFPLSHVTSTFSWHRWDSSGPCLLPTLWYYSRRCWQPSDSLSKGMEWEIKPLFVSTQVFLFKWAQPGKLCHVWGMSGYRKMERFSLVDLKGLYWGIFSTLWCNADCKEGMLSNCFE